MSKMKSSKQIFKRIKLGKFHFDLYDNFVLPEPTKSFKHEFFPLRELPVLSTINDRERYNRELDTEIEKILHLSFMKDDHKILVVDSPLTKSLLAEALLESFNLE